MLTLRQPDSLASIQNAAIFLGVALVFWFPHAVAALASQAIRKSNPFIAGVLGSLAIWTIAYIVEIRFPTALDTISSRLPPPVEQFTFPSYIAVSVAFVYAYAHWLRYDRG